MRTLILGWALATASIAPAGANCPAVDEHELVSFMVNLATVIGESDRLGGRSAQGLETWRSRLLRGDPELRDLSCQLLGDYPRLEPLMVHAADQIATGVISNQRAAKLSKGAGLCLSNAEFSAIVTVQFALEATVVVLQGICDGLGCVDFACIGPCGNLPLVKIGLEPLKGILETSAYTCLADHYEHMSGWATGTLGAQIKRAQSATLADIRRRTLDELVPAINQTQADFGRVDDFDDLQSEFTERLDETNDEIAQIRGGLDEDGERRARFQDQLDRLQVQQQLGASSGDLPLVLSLPASAGGRLETVREIVADAINSSVAAGLPEGGARDLLRSADALYNAGRFSAAAAGYRLAYQELVQ